MPPERVKPIESAIDVERARMRESTNRSERAMNRESTKATGASHQIGEHQVSESEP
jgi:hypothetical protein